jgi:predicted Zn-dependent peptidase
LTRRPGCPQPISWADFPRTVRRLDNGLTVLVREDHSAPVVAIVTHVRAGYFDEPDALVGISHVLEHMYFKGTARAGPARSPARPRPPAAT